MTIEGTYFGIVWTPSATQARMGAVYRAQVVTREAVMLAEAAQRSVQRPGTPASRQQGEWSRPSARQENTEASEGEQELTGSRAPL